MRKGQGFLLWDMSVERKEPRRCTSHMKGHQARKNRRKAQESGWT